MNIQEFQDLIGYYFDDLSLLDEALTHPSVKGVNNNYQRLEFFGDKVLGLVIGEYLIKNFPDENEGDLSKRYAYIVGSQSLYEIALNIHLDKLIKLSNGERMSGGAMKKNNLENCFEALIGAIYLDGGMDICRDFAIKSFADSLDESISPPIDPVSLLQEIVQERVKSLPFVEIVKVDGSDHDPIFEAHIVVEELGLDIRANGSSKKEANKNACQKALVSLNLNI